MSPHLSIKLINSRGRDICKTLSGSLGRIGPSLWYKSSYLSPIGVSLKGKTIQRTELVSSGTDVLLAKVTGSEYVLQFLSISRL